MRLLTDLPYLSDKDPQEIVPLAWDFDSQLACDEVITSVIATTSWLRTGGDIMVADLVFIDHAQILPGGRVVGQLTGGGQYDAQYEVMAKVYTSSGRIIVMAGILPITPRVSVYVFLAAAAGDSSAAALAAMQAHAAGDSSAAAVSV